MAAARSHVAARRAGPTPGSARLSGPTLSVIAATAMLAVIFATDQVLPATSAHQAQLRAWLGSRAAGITALLLLTFEVVLGQIGRASCRERV